VSAFWGLMLVEDRRSRAALVILSGPHAGYLGTPMGQASLLSLRGEGLRIRFLNANHQAMGAAMSHPPSQPSRSLWPVRLTVKAIGWSSSAVAVGALVMFALVLGLPSRKPWLAPFAILLFPIAIAFAVLGAPFWAIGAVCGLWLHEKEGVYGKLEPEGIRLDSLSTNEPGFIAWHVLHEVSKVIYPLSFWYELRLMDGSSVRVDFMDDAQLLCALEARGIPLREKPWHSIAENRVDALARGKR
jgi:hypothetical protein